MTKVDIVVAAGGWLRGPVPPREKGQGRRTEKKQESVILIDLLVIYICIYMMPTTNKFVIS